jgi:hypothetical protein
MYPKINRSQRLLPVSKCIYCGTQHDVLSDEHVVPYGLSGNLVLPKSSCSACAVITSKLEMKLLRGHWWPYRQFLGLKSRRSKQNLPELEVTIEHADGAKTAATLPMSKHSFAMEFHLAPPTILAGRLNADVPYAAKVFMRTLGSMPGVVRVRGKIHRLTPLEKLNIPVNFNAPDLCRFLAKIAHSYAIYRRGSDACEEYFLPRFVLGEEAGAMTYVGGASSAVLGSWLPGNGTHALLDRVQGQFLSVYIQLFRHEGDPPPIYEVIVGRLRNQVSL